MIVADKLLLAGAIAWLTTALVAKDGPFGVLLKLRNLLFRTLRSNSPLACFHCTSFWVGLLLVSMFVTGDESMRALIQFFGILGIAQALRGASNEYKP